MSQTIKPAKWLEAALWLLGVWDIFEQTTSEVVNDEGDELWTCNLAFDIPTRYNHDLCQDIVHRGRQMPNQMGAQFYTVLHCLQALERISYHMSDFSCFQLQALCEHNLDVPLVSKRHVRFIQMDVVSRVWFQSNVYLFLLLYERFLIVFVYPLAEFALWFHLCCKWHAAHSHTSYWATGVCLGLHGRPGLECHMWYPVLHEN